MRTVLDWLLTIAAAVAVVLVFEAEVAKPYRVPSASMEPTLHCARPADGCEARFSDRVIACEVCYRGGSCDSRIWGSVTRSNLIGPVLVRYWPPARAGFDLP